MELSPVVNALIKEFERPKPVPGEGVPLTVSRTVSILAVLYEKARNAVEFRAEHLVRRAAIERILKRRIIVNGGSSAIAENLVIELLWARYIDSSVIDETKTGQIQQIVDRYLFVRQTYFGGQFQKDGLTWNHMLGLASAEIEETLVSARKRDALTNFFYQAIRPKIKIPGQDETGINVQTFIAVERAYAQADEALISYHLLRLTLLSWFEVNHNDLPTLLPKFVSTLQQILQDMREPLNESLYRFARRQTPAFLLIRDVFFTLDDKARATVEDRILLEQKLAEVASLRYQETGVKVRRAVIRGFIYIFLTKMIFALALEAPYDLYIAQKVVYLPLVVNALFPPLLMAAVAGLIAVPGSENTKRLIDRVSKILYHFDSLKDETDVFVPKQRVRRPLLTAVFSVLYLVTFTLTFWVIHVILGKLHFNIVSQLVFIFFVALVTFFAYRIRQSAKEYEVVERQGVLEPVMDFLFLPILRAGHFLSREIARLNLFIFLFDFILEAPLKVIFEVVEEWIRFIRTKKEEII